MQVGVMRIDLALYAAGSLKDKRRVIKSLKDGIRARFNVSVAEVDHLEARQRATLAVAVVANEGRFIHGVLDRIVDFVRAGGQATLLDYERRVE
jgi:uncharacterized protein YlxP (DUF503 family)